ncbi:MAG TPA: peptidoglycan-associated lipoprotein Pal [Gemmatimonadaceae bacterium]|nr:peptidoglycan-associated lipoprotein Pal [Gemmatimonadaceae bacterium]
MFRFARIGGLTLAVVSVAVIDACHKKPAPEPVPATMPTPGPNQDSIRAAEAARARADAEAAAKRRADSIAAADAAARAAAAAAGDLKNALEAMVHFDFDQSELRPQDRSILDAKVPILQANPSVTLRIAGYTDERGSDEYNLALGQRRAATVKRYLVDHGISDTRIETVSYGEEHPIAQGSDESAWSQNRRAEFAITAGGQMLRKP